MPAIGAGGSRRTDRSGFRRRASTAAAPKRPGRTSLGGLRFETPRRDHDLDVIALARRRRHPQQVECVAVAVGQHQNAARHGLGDGGICVGDNLRPGSKKGCVFKLCRQFGFGERHVFPEVFEPRGQ